MLLAIFASTGNYFRPCREVHYHVRIHFIVLSNFNHRIYRPACTWFADDKTFVKRRC